MNYNPHFFKIALARRSLISLCTYNTHQIHTCQYIKIYLHISFSARKKPVFLNAKVHRLINLFTLSLLRHLFPAPEKCRDQEHICKQPCHGMGQTDSDIPKLPSYDQRSQSSCNHFHNSRQNRKYRESHSLNSKSDSIYQSQKTISTNTE